MRSLSPIFSSAVLVAALSSAASATVLTFDFGGVTGDPILTSYGQRVTNFNNGSFMYGPDGGVTPNVVVDYTPQLNLGAVGGPMNPQDPTRVFGDLTNVLYRNRNGGFTPGILQITLSADLGYMVCLHRFDLAATFNAVTGVGEDLPARSIQVLDQAGNTLYQLDYDSSVPTPGTTYIPGTQPLRDRRFDWDANPLCARAITIRLDFTQLITIGGSKVDRIGIDNIKFSQTPSPGAAGLLLGGLGALAMRRRRG